ncbi:MAG TPA: hypothetical protein VJ697_12960 [Nitrososphaeraceae archaeon]|nr:hypothetical protein [Nitrososphaeraceae archaeon]
MKYYLRSQDSKYPCEQPPYAVSLPQDSQSDSSEDEIIYFQNLNDTLIKENEQFNEEINRKDTEIHKIKQERNNLRNENIQLRQLIQDLRIQILNLQNDINFVRNVIFCLGGFFMSWVVFYMYRRIPFEKF